MVKVNENEMEVRLAAARRRAAQLVPGWRKVCGCFVDLADQEKGFGIPCRQCLRERQHGDWCVTCGGAGWFPGVNESDGRVREIHMEDVLAQATLPPMRGVKITTTWEYVVMQGQAYLRPSPDALLLAALENFCEAMEAEYHERS